MRVDQSTPLHPTFFFEVLLESTRLFPRLLLGLVDPGRGNPGAPRQPLDGLHGSLSAGGFSFAFGNKVEVDSNYVSAFYSDNENYQGKVGINKPDPEEALHVNGNVKIENNLEVDGVVTFNDVLRLTPREEAPDPAAVGMIYYDSDDGGLWVCVDVEPDVWREVQLIVPE